MSHVFLPTFSERSMRYAQTWRDDLPKGMQDEEMTQEPGAPEKVLDSKPVCTGPSPTMHEILLRIETNFNTQMTGLSAQVTTLTTKVDDLNDTIQALNKQVTNLTSMSGCDKLRTLLPCGNHLKTVSMRGLTDKQIQLVNKIEDQVQT
jgi:hypothetical protein